MAVMASGIQKCGYLKIKRPPTSGKVRIKAWQLKYFVLRDAPPTFEYFKDELSFSMSRNTKEKNKINMENVIHIGTTDASKTQRNAFMIVDAEHGATMLATDSEEETKEWVEALSKVSRKSVSVSPGVVELSSPEMQPLQSVVNKSIGSPEIGCVSLSDQFQGFSVTTRLTPSSEKLGIRDDYTMYITHEYVAIHDVDTNALVVQWPIVGLRGWKSEPADTAGRRCTQLLTLEAGRKSTTGEGLYQFFTDFGNIIANNIRVRSNELCRVTAVEKREKFKEKSTSFEDVFLDEPIKPQSFVRSNSNSMAIKPQKILLRERSASDNNIVVSKKLSSSPQSSRKELLQDQLTKNFKPIIEDDVTCTMQAAEHAYLDLISDADATPIHIPDPYRRKSLDSLSQTSDEDIIQQKTLSSLPNEMNGGENYIDDREINDYRQNGLKDKPFDSKTTYVDPLCMKSMDTKSKKQGSNPSNTLCQDFLNQISNPQSHQENIFKDKENCFQCLTPKDETESTQKLCDLAGKSEQSLEQTIDDSIANNNNCTTDQSEKRLQLSAADASTYVEQEDKQNAQMRHGFTDENKRDETKELLEKLVSNLESPQSCVQGKIILPKSDDVMVMRQEEPATRRLDAKRTVEKSKSHCGFESSSQTDKPPPLPQRPEFARTKASASLGDISKDLTRPLDFHKDLHRQLNPWSSNPPALGTPWGPESLVHARLLQRSTSGSSLGAVKGGQQGLRSSEKTVGASTDRPRSQSTRCSLDSPPPIQENELDDDFDGKKRRSSKASIFITRMLNTLTPSDSKRRASCDSVSTAKDFDIAKRGRSCSVVPGGIVNEGWSPEQSLDVPSPEGSPQTFRKLLPGARRLSHDPCLDRSRKLFIGSPTFDSRTKEEIKMREKARERERERSELPNEPPPQLPPRKKSDPPPLPPRIRKSSSDSSCSGTSSPQSRQPSNADEAIPPPIPPRRLDDRRSTAPAIHLTISSPDEKPLERILAELTGKADLSSSSSRILQGASRSKQPTDDIQSNTHKQISRPIPQRPRPPALQNQACAFELDDIKKNIPSKSENSFVSIDMHGENLFDDNNGTGNPTNKAEAYSPNNASPLSMNLQSRSGGLVLNDSPTSPISV